MTPTKADSLHERMEHAFGEKRINHVFQNMVSLSGKNLLDYLTDEARDELLRRCIGLHKRTRRFAAASREHYREQQERKVAR